MPPAPRPATLLGPELVHAISPSHWQRLFSAHGYPAGLTPHDARSLPKIEQSLLASGVPRALLQTLETLEALATDAGRDALLAAATDRKVSTTDWPDSEGPPDLAARLLADAATDETIAAVVERASLALHRAAAQKPWREFIGAEVRTLAHPAAHVPALRREIESWCSKNGRGDYADIRILQDGAETHYQILHAQRRKTPVAVEGGTLKRLSYLPLGSDAVRYDAASGRLRVASSSPSLVPFYRSLFGRVLFGDVAFFSDRATCTLDPILARGAAALDAPELRATVLRARVIECLWDGGEEATFLVRARDALAAMQSHGFRGGKLAMAKLRLELAGSGAAARADVVVRPPHRVDVPRGARGVIARDYLAAIGVLSPSNGDEDLWSLDPFVHAESRWRSALGVEVDSMLARGLFVRIQRRAVEHPDHDGAGRALLAFPLAEEPGAFYGVSDDPDVPPRTLEAGDLAAYRLDLLAVARAIAKDLELDRPSDTFTHPAALDLGTRRFGAVALRFFLVARDPGAGAAALVTLARRLANPGHAVLIVPRGRSAGTGLAEIALPRIGGPYRALLAEAVVACGLEADVDAVHCAPPGTRLVLDTRSQKAWFDGVPMERLGERGFRFFELLAAQKGRAIGSKALGELLSPGRADDVTAREAKMKARQSMEESFAAKGVDPPEDLDAVVVRDHGSGYRLAASCFVR